MSRGRKSKEYSSRSSQSKKKVGDPATKRILVSLFLVLAGFGIYIVRAGYISMFSEELKEKAKAQSKTTIVIKGKRGKIYDRNGKLIAKDIPSYSLWMNPQTLRTDEAKRKNIYEIAKILKIDQKEISDKLQKKVHFVWIKRQLTEDEFRSVKRIIERFSRNEVGVIKEWKRFYPYGDVVAHITGFVNIDSEGLAGLELYYDRKLKGKEIKLAVLRDALGRIIMNFPPDEPPPGYDIYTTVDIDLQLLLFEELKNQMQNMKAKGAFAIAIDPNTGEVLAGVSLPSFDPNYPSKYPEKSRQAKFYQYVFEPGSVFKIFVVASALESDIISPTDSFFCHEGKWDFKSITIRDVKKIGYATPREIVALSSNICASQISLLLGKERLYNYLKRLGFGSKTGVDLPGEESGLLSHFSRWYDVDLAVIGFGYFIGVTPLQIATAFSSIVNDGYILRPYIVSKIVSPHREIIYQAKPEFRDKIFSKQTCELMKSFMRETVISGTGKRAEIPFFLSAGKTGTSRKLKNGKYVKEYISSFIGFSPYEDPKIVLFVVFDEPEEAYYGGEVASPVFASVVEKYLSSHLQFSINSENSYDKSYSGTSSQKVLLSKFLDSLPQDKLKEKKVTIKGYGFVNHVEETEDEIVIQLSPN